MTMFSLHTELLHGVTTDPRGGWSLPGALALAGVLAAVLIGGAFATPRSASIGETMAPALPSVTTIISTSAPQSVRVAAAAPAAVTQPPFACGFLQIDRDSNAPGGAPGFASWPSRELRVAEASPRN